MYKKSRSSQQASSRKPRGQNDIHDFTKGTLVLRHLIHPTLHANWLDFRICLPAAQLAALQHCSTAAQQHCNTAGTEGRQHSSTAASSTDIRL
jgi:hypothetical protein